MARYPRALRLVSILFAVYYLSPVSQLKAIWDQFSSFIISEVMVSSEEDLYEFASEWIADQKTIRADNTLNALSSSMSSSTIRRQRHASDSGENIREPPQKAKIRYEQSQGLQIFVYKRRIFFFSRTYGFGHSYFNGTYRRSELLHLRCLGRSTEPIRELLQEIFIIHKDKEKSLTIIRRPQGVGYGDSMSWSRITAKQKRALDTVILEGEQKQKIIADITEYMDSETQDFYAQHGIPYRRGYLFHGPPGVGKTSFALALAAKFGLDVYVLSLTDKSLSDSFMLTLLTQLPSRALLLLEDIDTAGLNRNTRDAKAALARRKLGLGPKTGKDQDKKDNEMDEEELGALADASGEDSGRVTLSGLLNAIDGVASPEGHILIMTTNKPDDLDDALVRAGRISVRVAFKNASRVQARELFERMYVKPPVLYSDPVLEAGRIKKCAEEFAERIPDGEFSPADLQEFLLVHKRSPEGAVGGVEEWKREILQERGRREEERRVEREARREEKRLLKEVEKEEWEEWEGRGVIDVGGFLRKNPKLVEVVRRFGVELGPLVEADEAGGKKNGNGEQLNGVEAGEGGGPGEQKSKKDEVNAADEADMIVDKAAEAGAKVAEAVEVH
jgi:chaperone BCS1